MYLAIGHMAIGGSISRAYLRHDIVEIGSIGATCTLEICHISKSPNRELVIVPQYSVTLVCELLPCPEKN